MKNRRDCRVRMQRTSKTTNTLDTVWMVQCKRLNERISLGYQMTRLVNWSITGHKKVYDIAHWHEEEEEKEDRWERSCIKYVQWGSQRAYVLTRDYHFWMGKLELYSPIQIVIHIIIICYTLNLSKIIT